MPRNVYVASIEPGCGKSVVSLGVCNLLGNHRDKFGYFRPIISDRAGRDPHIELIRRRYCADRPYESLYGVSHETARHRSDAGQMELLFEEIDRRYQELISSCHVVICEGTDHSELAAPFDFDFEARMAKHLDCRVVLVTCGRRRSPQDAVDVASAAYDAFTRLECDVAASVINRVPANQIAEVRERLAARAEPQWPCYVLTEAETLSRPTARQVAEAIGARVLFDDTRMRPPTVSNVRVAAMHLPNFLKYVDEGSLVITPGDRTDVLLATLASRTATTYPDIAGLILTGGLVPDAAVMNLLEGSLPLPVPIYLTNDDTYVTAMKVHSARPATLGMDDSKVAMALETFAAGVDDAQFAAALLA